MRAFMLIISVAAMTACNGAPDPDAFGNFESTEVVVSAETSGQIREFTPVEGMTLARGAIAVVIDTTQLALERHQILAQRAATGSRGNEATAQIRVLDVQRDVALRNFERTRRLFAEQAATAQQLDQSERDYRALVAQIDAARAQRQSTTMDVATATARVEQVSDRLSKSRVVNPRGGTVLATYARAGEVVQPGQQLYRIADLDTMVLRAYVSGEQLARVRLGQSVEVNVDRGGNELRAMQGTITWISPSAEFTPTPIQTRDERGSLVYAIKVSVPNPDGTLRIGMPGDVTLPPPAGK
jgi:HlyD family secretion protein